MASPWRWRWLPRPACAAQGAGLGAAGELVDPDVLRVCADPSNIPFTDESGKGFENKLAELVAAKTGRKSVSYTWFPMVMGFVRNTLRANRCDIIMGYAQGDEQVQNTNAYYRSTYVIMYRKGGGLKVSKRSRIRSLADKRIGVVMARRRLRTWPRRSHEKGQDLPPDARHALRAVHGRDDAARLESGEIDAAVVWGPMGGYYAKQIGATSPSCPLVNEKAGSRMVYRITMGVRPSDQEWKRPLNTVIRENQDEINKILLDFGIPLIDEQDRPITQ